LGPGFVFFAVVIFFSSTLSDDECSSLSPQNFASTIFVAVFVALSFSHRNSLVSFVYRHDEQVDQFKNHQSNLEKAILEIKGLTF